MRIAPKQMKLFTNNGAPALLKNKIRERDNKEYARAYHQKNIVQSFERRLKTQYGITLEDYKLLREQQFSRCAICGAHETKGQYGRLYVDHDHKTGKVRGLLCSHCNLGIGKFNEDVSIMNRAMIYIVQGGVPLKKFTSNR